MKPSEWRFPEFTRRFRELRGTRDNTEFGKFLGISRQTVGFYYNGDRIPDAQGIKQIAEKCGVSADWLLGLTDIKSPNISIRDISDYTGLSESTIHLLHSRFGKFPSQFINLICDRDDGYRLADAVLQYMTTAETAFRALYLEYLDCFEESRELFDAKAHIVSARLAKLFAEDTFRDFLEQISPLNFDSYYEIIESEVFGGRYFHPDSMGELLKRSRQGKEATGNG